MSTYLLSRVSYVLFLLIISCLFSCKDGEVSPTAPTTVKRDTCIVVKATEARTGLSAGTTPMNFEYDSKKRLIKKTYQFEDELSDNYITFEYDTKDRVSKAISVGIPVNTYTEQYEYNSQDK
jgi:hypothetical protein